MSLCEEWSKRPTVGGLSMVANEVFHGGKVGGEQSTLFMIRSCWGSGTRASLLYRRPTMWCDQQRTSMCSRKQVWRCHSSQPVQRLTFWASVTPGTQASFQLGKLCLWPPPRPKDTSRMAGNTWKNMASNRCHLTQHYGGQNQDDTDPTTVQIPLWEQLIYMSFKPNLPLHFE